MKQLKLRRIFIYGMLFSFFSTTSYGQSGGKDSNSIFFEDSLTDAYTVMGTTAAGVVLGVSTLSFVDHPSEHLKRVVVAGAIGLIVGVGYIAFKTASSGHIMYNEGSAMKSSSKDFGTSARVAWYHNKSSEKLESLPPTQVGFNFSF